jgi:hypothetical protein
LYRHVDAEEKHYNRTRKTQNNPYQHGSSPGGGYNPARDTNAYQYTSSAYDNSPTGAGVGAEYQNTDEFEGEDVDRQLIRRTTNNQVEDVEVIVRHMPSDEVEEVYVDDMYIGAYNTNVRAIQRDQIKQEKQAMLQDMELKYRQNKQQKHKAKVDAIASKIKDRALPYGLNYSKVKDSVQKVAVETPKSKKVGKQKFKQLVDDRAERYDYIETSQHKTRSSKRSHTNKKITAMSSDRLGTKHHCNKVSIYIVNCCL